MTRSGFRTADGRHVPAVTAAEMRRVDEVAVETVGLELLQMMENAGRILARHVRDVRDGDGPVTVVAGNGGNGGGGMTCARHLANRDVPVQVLTDRPAEALSGAAAHQHSILEAMAVPTGPDADALAGGAERDLVVDALVGYGLTGEVRPPASRLIERMNHRSGPILALDVPSGVDATSGETLGTAVSADRTVTLALPKTGLESVPGPLYLADIGIPTTVYERLDVAYEPPFGDDDWVRLNR